MLALSRTTAAATTTNTTITTTANAAFSAGLHVVTRSCHMPHATLAYVFLTNICAIVGATFDQINGKYAYKYMNIYIYVCLYACMCICIFICLCALFVYQCVQRPRIFNNLFIFACVCVSSYTCVGATPPLADR